VTPGSVGVGCPKVCLCLCLWFSLSRLLLCCLLAACCSLLATANQLVVGSSSLSRPYLYLSLSPNISLLFSAQTHLLSFILLSVSQSVAAAPSFVVFPAAPVQVSGGETWSTTASGPIAGGCQDTRRKRSSQSLKTHNIWPLVARLPHWRYIVAQPSTWYNFQMQPLEGAAEDLNYLGTQSRFVSHVGLDKSPPVSRLHCQRKFVRGLAILQLG
jgi:hypothetical protein